MASSEPSSPHRSAGNHTLSRRETLREFLNVISSAPAADDAAFQRVIHGCRGLLELSEQDLADKLNVSRPTVNRWANGKNLPHRALRNTIFDWASTEVKRRIREIGSGSGTGSPMAAASGR